MFFYLYKGKNFVQGSKKIGPIYEDESTVCKWVTKIINGIFDLEDWESFNRPAVTYDDKIEILINNSPGDMTLDIAQVLHISDMIVLSH